MTKPEEHPEEPDLRVMLYPDDSAVKPNKLAFQYHEPTVIVPPHLPEALLHPEKWRFYDPNTDLKFDNPPTTDFAGGVKYDQYQDLEKDKEAREGYLRRLTNDKPVPAVGTYDPEVVKERPPAYDFGKAPRFEEAEDLEDVDQEGDVLILNPHPKEKVPVLVDMSRTRGREQPVDDKEEREELLIEPKHDLVKKRVPMLVNMTRETGRPVDDEQEEEKLILEPNRDVVMPRTKVLVDMGRQQGREEHHDEEDAGVQVGDTDAKYEQVQPRRVMLVDMARQTGRPEPEESLEMSTPPPIIDIVDPSKPRILGIPDFERTTGREVPKEEVGELFSDPSQEADLDRAYKSTLPSVPVPAFDRYQAHQEWTEEPDDMVKVEEYVNVHFKVKKLRLERLNAQL
jgi:hypothetical protein